MKSVNVCASANSKYQKYLYVMLVSLFENNKDLRVNVYIMQRDFTFKDKSDLESLADKYNSRIIFIQVDEEDFNVLPTTERYSLETYFRFKIPDLLPIDVDKVLYLDVDIIVDDSINELFEINIDGYFFAACRDMMEPELIRRKQHLFNRYDDLRYFNAGVMLWNLKEIREHVRFEDYINAGEKLGFDLPCVDQDILNYLYYNDTKYLDPLKYNYLMLHALDHVPEFDDTKIFHFNWYAPWQVGPKSDGYRIWWRYAELSPYYIELLQEQLFRMEKYAYDEYTNMYQKNDESESILNRYKSCFRIKGKGVLSNWLDKHNRKVFIFGAGEMAEVLYETFAVDSALGFIVGVHDRFKNGRFHNIDICNAIEHQEIINGLGDDVDIVITPIQGAEKIKKDIMAIGPKCSVYIMNDYIDKIFQYYEVQ